MLKRLDEGFADLKATDITAGRVAAYQAEQKKAGYANGTINRDMAALKRMFRLGLRLGAVASVPHIQMFHEDNIRSGFFEPASSNNSWRISLTTSSPCFASPTSPDGE